MDLSARIIGMMSGTSVDAIDAVLVEFREQQEGLVEFRVLGNRESSLDPELRRRTLAACASEARTREVCELNFALGESFAETALALLSDLGLKPEEVDLIASHGQTVWHQVEAGQAFSTLQIAEPAVIATRTGITTAADFRVADVAMGGQGAPLASFFDFVFFSDPHKNRALQNIGGIGNVTFIPAGSDYKAARAFDTGPGNVLIDFAAADYSGGALSYDAEGKIGASGVVDEGWLSQLMALPYFKMPPPKTTGRELFSYNFWLEAKAEAEKRGLTGADIVATLTAFTARSIAEAYRDFGPSVPVDEVIVGGGGGRNPFLLELLQKELGSQTKVRLNDEFGLDAKLKEAVFFALFGFELLRGRPANLPACTGAQDFTMLGQLTPGRNYASLLKRFVPHLPDKTPGLPLRRLSLMQ
jgi:anhydro-N-acetylmuramic acid kinase